MPRAPSTAPRKSCTASSVPCFFSSSVSVAGKMAGKARNMPPNAGLMATPASRGDDRDTGPEEEAQPQLRALDVAQLAGIHAGDRVAGARLQRLRHRKTSP